MEDCSIKQEQNDRRSICYFKTRGERRAKRIRDIFQNIRPVCNMRMRDGGFVRVSCLEASVWTLLSGWSSASPLAIIFIGWTSLSGSNSSWPYWLIAVFDTDDVRLISDILPRRLRAEIFFKKPTRHQDKMRSVPSINVTSTAVISAPPQN